MAIGFDYKQPQLFGVATHRAKAASNAAGRLAWPVWLTLLGLLLLTGSPASGGTAGGAAVVAASIVIIIALALPLHRLPRRIAPLLGHAAILLVLAIELAIPRRWDMHNAVVLALPLLWLAVYHSRRHVVIAMVEVGLVCFVPILLGASPSSFDLLVVGVSVTAALLVSHLARLVRVEGARTALAHTDVVTGLPNRAAWDEGLAGLLEVARRRRVGLNVALVDLDGFADFNQDWGHEAADRLLVATAEQMRAEVPSGELVARTGADEFSIASLGPEPATLVETVQALRDGLRGQTDVTAGLVIWNRVESAAELTARVEAAERRARRRRGVDERQIVAVDTAEESTSWRDRVPQLIDSQRVESVYQPIVDLARAEPVAYEALARPLGAAASLAVDGMFVEAKRQGLAWKLEMLCLQAALRGGMALGSETPLFVNIGPGSLRDPESFLAFFDELLARAGRSPGTVVLEISETVAYLRRFGPALRVFRGRGFRFALDDVGEGTSSLEALASVAPEFVKLARSLVVNAGEQATAATIRAIIEFARTTGASVIAEGVETAEQRRSIADFGISLAQGFAFGRPARLPVSQHRAA